MFAVLWFFILNINQIVPKEKVVICGTYIDINDFEANETSTSIRLYRVSDTLFYRCSINELQCIEGIGVLSRVNPRTSLGYKQINPITFELELVPDASYIYNFEIISEVDSKKITTNNFFYINRNGSVIDSIRLQ